MWRITAFILIIIFLILFTTHANAARVYISKDSRVYHHDRNCSKLNTTDDLIEFSSPGEAKASGGILCEHCDPSAVKDTPIPSYQPTEAKGREVEAQRRQNEKKEAANVLLKDKPTDDASELAMCQHLVQELEVEVASLRAQLAKRYAKESIKKKQKKSKLATFGGKYYNKLDTYDYMEFFTDRGKVFIDANGSTLMADYFINGDEVVINHSYGFTARGKITDNTIVFPVIHSRDFPPLALIFRGTWTKRDDLQ